ncbi:MAG: class I mannose-6-phosphate isomerase [Eubacteriales bacterium]|nr:class I mannose-6-phosphate isomerase [Eubacteriales bacterium]
MYPLKFEPLYKEYLWGGRNLEKIGKKLPAAGNVAESWEAACRPDGMSIIANGIYKDLPLKNLILSEPAALLGKSFLPGRDIISSFPLLVKFIDANDDLSIQVHPDNDYAASFENGESGKNEMWYILDAAPGAKIICGLKPGVTRSSLLHSLEDRSWPGQVEYLSVAAGDMINIPSGTIHAIGKGIMVAEIQQNSNITYRIFDYGRKDSCGRSRELHTDKAMDVIFRSGSAAAGNSSRADLPAGKVKGIRQVLSSPRVANSGSKPSYKTDFTANSYFTAELFEVDGELRYSHHNSNGNINVNGNNSSSINRSNSHSNCGCGSSCRCKRPFEIWIFLEGDALITQDNTRVDVSGGETILIPSSPSEYAVTGRFKALRTKSISAPGN